MLAQFQDYAACTANRTFARYANGAPFARVRKNQPPLDAPGFIGFPLQVGTHRNGKPVLFTELQHIKLQAELCEALRPLYRQWFAAHSQPAQMPEVLATIESGPMLRIASPVEPSPLAWDRRAISADSIPVGLAHGFGGAQSVAWNRTIDHHVIVAGATGSGKSVLMRLMLLSLALATDPGQMELVLIDPKNRGLEELARLPHVRQPMAWNPSDMAAMLAAVDVELSARIAKNSPASPVIILAIDEVADLLEGNAVLQSLYARINKMGREQGIHTIAGTQKPMLTELGQGPTQATFQAVGRMQRSRDTRIATGLDVPADALPYPGLFYIASNGRAPQVVQVPFVSEDDARRTVGQLARQHGEVSPSVLRPGVAPVTVEDRRVADGWKRAAADAVKLWQGFGDGWKEQSERQQMIYLGINPSGGSYYSGQKRLDMVREIGLD